jgi:hypothetical protein
MQILSQITSDPYQSIPLTSDDGTLITMILRYFSTQQFWSMSISSGLFQLNGIRITNEMNILGQYINQITYGIACMSVDLEDPFLINDFSAGRSNLYLLNATECQTIANAIKNPGV